MTINNSDLYLVI